MLSLSLEVLRGIAQNGPTDPIEFYRRPFVGKLFRERINRGLRLLGDERFESALEVGYGAGAVLIALAPAVDKLHGIDLDADPKPVETLLKSQGREAELRPGDVTQLPYSDASFDLVVSFSVFEHLHEYRKALKEVYRVLKPGGLFLLGMPAVNRVMEAGFMAIGFKGIDDHHVTTPRAVSTAFADAGFRLTAKDTLGLPMRAPLGMTVYSVWALKK
jgi:SAM-dependent methyltransferase